MNGVRKDRLGDYEMLEPLGQGSRGRVFKARCVADNNPRVSVNAVVALKVLHTPGQDARDAERFRERALALCDLQHPHVVRTLDAFVWRPGEWDEVRCVVTEFLEGETLENRLAREMSGLDWPDVRRWFTQAIDGLAAASARGIMHRDLKPSNLFLCADGSLRVIDFDIVRKEESGQASTAAWKGSFDYMAPDFVTEPDFRGDERSDIFSLGICFYEALTGKLPFEGLGKGAHVAYLNRWFGAEKPPEISYRNPLFRVLSNARRFVERAVHPSRADRFATFAEMAEEFAKIHQRVIRNGDKDAYELEAVLGRGGFGEVFLARRQRDGLKVAVKHLFAQKQSDRFVREAHILQRCRHPQICRHIDFFTLKTPTEEQYYLVMEYLEGMPGWSLRNRIKKEGALPVDEVIPLFINYLKALQFLHEGKRPIIHRDLKPTNLYAPARHPEKGCIFDLGVARDVTGTVTYGGVPGTLDYMAPEFARPGSDRGTPQTDLYAIGLCLYEALTGTSAYRKLPTNMNVAWTEFQARAEERRPIAFDAPVFKEHPALASVVRRATAHDPAERLPSARAMIAELEAALTGMEEGDAPTRATTTTRFTSLSSSPPAGATKSDDSVPSATTPRPASAPAAVPPPVAQGPVTMTRAAPAQEEREAPITSATRMDDGAGEGMQWASRQRRKRLILRAGIGLVALGLAVLTAKLLTGGTGKPAALAAEEWVEAVKEPQPTADYVIRVRDCLARLKEMAATEPKRAAEWQVHISAVERKGRQVPDQFKERFGLAAVSRQTEETTRLLAEWEQLKGYLDVLGLDAAGYEERRDYMRRMADRLLFEQTAAELQKRIPARITDDATRTQAEAASSAYRVFVGRTWEGIAGDERRRQFEALGAAVSNVAIAYLVEQSAAGNAETYQKLPQQVPALVEVGRAAYDAGLRRSDAARRAREGEAAGQKLQAEIAVAPTFMALDPLVRRFAEWEQAVTGTAATNGTGSLVAALTARYRDHIAAEVQLARAAYADGRVEAGDAHAQNAKAMAAQVPERFGRAEQLRGAADLASARQDVEARMAREEEQKKQMAAEQQRREAETMAAQQERDRRAALSALASNLAGMARGLAEAAPAQWTAAFDALARTDAVSLRDPDVKKSWDAAALELGRVLDAGLAQKEPLTERAVRVETVSRILTTAGADRILGAVFAGLRSRLEAQRGRCILRLANTSSMALTVSGGELVRKTIVPPAQRLDLTLAGPFSPGPLSLLVEGGEGWKPRALSVQVAGGGGVEVSLAALERAEMDVKPAGDAETGVLRISVSPRTARILLDGKEVEAGDLVVRCDDNHTVRVEAAGYVTFEQSYRVSAGKTKTLDILLEPARKR